jgi:hypothetical protein
MRYEANICALSYDIQYSGSFSIANSIILAFRLIFLIALLPFLSYRRHQVEDRSYLVHQSLTFPLFDLRLKIPFSCQAHLLSKLQGKNLR